MSQESKARAFKELHSQGRILVLPNAWDVASARIFEEAGFPAVATTSAGVAWSLGYPDGQAAPLEEVLAVVRRIVDSVAVPVTADLESGYADVPGGVAETVRRLLGTGAVGVNLEDAPGESGAPLLHTAVEVGRLEAARTAADREGIDLFINARTDVFWRSTGDAGTRLARAAARIRIYRDAGADGVFVPGTGDPDTLRALVKATDAPLNVLAAPGGPGADGLEALGVRRLTIGSGAARAVFAMLTRVATELRGRGTCSFLEEAVPYAQADRWFVPSHGSQPPQDKTGECTLHPAGQDRRSD